MKRFQILELENEQKNTFEQNQSRVASDLIEKLLDDHPMENRFWLAALWDVIGDGYTKVERLEAHTKIYLDFYKKRINDKLADKFISEAPLQVKENDK